MADDFNAPAPAQVVDLEMDSETEDGSIDTSNLDQLKHEMIEDVRDEILSNLQSIELGPVAGFNRLDNLPDPQSQVGHSVITLPLKENDAQVIIQASQLTWIGKGEQRIEDTTAKKYLATEQ